MQTNNHHWSKFWHIQTTILNWKKAQRTGWKMHTVPSLNIERHHENMHEFFSIVKVMGFSLNLTTYGSLLPTTTPLVNNQNMRAKKNVNQFTFSIEQIFCKGDVPSNGKCIFGGGWKILIWIAIWIDGWILFHPKMQIFRELNCLRTWSTLCGSIIYIATEKYPFFFGTDEKCDSKQKYAQLYINKFIAFVMIWFGLFRKPKLLLSCERMVSVISNALC